MYALESHLAPGGLHHGAIQCPGQDLRAETDAEIGDAGLNGLSRERAVLEQERVSIDLVGVDRRREEYQTGDLAELRERLFLERVDEQELGAGGPKRWHGHAVRLEPVVPHEDQRLHRSECTGSPGAAPAPRRLSRARSTEPAPSRSPWCCRR